MSKFSFLNISFPFENVIDSTEVSGGGNPPTQACAVHVFAQENSLEFAFDSRGIIDDVAPNCFCVHSFQEFMVCVARGRCARGADCDLRTGAGGRRDDR
jgi:hypothetical protein